MKRSMDVLAVALICLGFVVSGLFYADLPDSMPTHFGVNGQADGFTPLPWSALMLPLGALLLLLLLRGLPAISPKGFCMDRFLGAYQMVVLGAVAFMIALHVGLIWRLSQGHTTLGGWVPILVGLLFAFIGNYLNKTEDRTQLFPRHPHAVDPGRSRSVGAPSSSRWLGGLCVWV